MFRRLVWMAAGFGVAVLGLLVLTRPEPCYACSTQSPPPQCTANMSAMTVRKADERRVWWDFLDRREERTLRVYLGMNMNNGTVPLSYTYQLRLEPSSDWRPTSLSPITGTGTLSPGQNNTTIEVTLPYSITDAGDLNLAATMGGTCPFNPSVVTTTVRINDQGPTVWPITSRACPVAGEKPTFRFGVRNPGEQPQTYSVVARAENQFGGEHTPTLNDDSTQQGVHQFPDLTLQPNESQEVAVTCETFGFCLTGSESRVNLEVGPAASSAEQFNALASSNVTVRDPAASCPAMEDWWFIMPPRVFWGLLGTPLALVAGGAAWYFRPRKVTHFSGDDWGGPGSKSGDTFGKAVDKGGRAAGTGGEGGFTR